MRFDLTTLGIHQREGFEACIAGFETFDRLQVHMACGTGKTRLGQAVASAIGPGYTLVLFPSLALIAQTLESWIEEGDLRNQDILCVCSDPSVAEQEDDSAYLLPIKVCTDPVDVSRFFLGRERAQETYIFCTYHSLESLARGLPDWLDIDLCIFDEAHRVVGEVDKSFTYGLNNHAELRVKKRLFMTATPRLIATEEGDEDHVYSMSNEGVFGPVVYKLSLQEAIDRGIICDYQVIVSLQDDSLVGEGENEASAGENALTFKAASLLQTMEKVGAKKAFTFHQRIALSQHFSETLKSVADHREVELDAWHVDGAMSEGQRHEILRSFSRAPFSVVSCSRCLSEGTNVPVTDLVAFMDPRSSETDIIQTLGRALRRAPGKSMGYVLIPLRLVPGQTVEQMLASSEMRHIWRVLGSVAEMDERYIAQLRKVRRDLSPDKWSGAKVQMLEKVSIQASESVTEQAYRSLRFHLVDRLTSRWDSSFGELYRFHQEHGHAAVGKRYCSPSGFRLGSWCAAQRILAKAGVLAPERKSELLDLGFDFDPQQSNWDEYLHELARYQAEYGSANVPQGYETQDGVQLGDWCSEQRKAYKASRLSEERRSALSALGFSFSPSEESWSANYELLKTLHNQNCDATSTRQDDLPPTLRTWLENQRKRKISPERRVMLEAIGVRFSSKADDAWDDAFSRLKSFFEASGGDHPSLGHRTDDGFAIGNWVSNQRQVFSQGKMLEARRSKLADIGFIFNAEEAAFEKGLAELKIFKGMEGHCRVPTSYVSDSGFKLGAWCANVRSRLKRGLGEARREKLMTIGFLT